MRVTMDFKELAENVGVEEEAYLELIELFIETGMSDLDTLSSAIKEKNSDKAADSAHSLKGAASNLGLMDFYEAAKKIEEGILNDRLEETAEDAQTLKEKLDIIAEYTRG
jgi:HPt (histidine-containing phosphotransfer) domain-containing protein